MFCDTHHIQSLCPLPSCLSSWATAGWLARAEGTGHFWMPSISDGPWSFCLKVWVVPFSPTWSRPTCWAWSPQASQRRDRSVGERDVKAAWAGKVLQTVLSLLCCPGLTLRYSCTTPQVQSCCSFWEEPACFPSPQQFPVVWVAVCSPQGQVVPSPVLTPCGSAGCAPPPRSHCWMPHRPTCPGLWSCSWKPALVCLLKLPQQQGTQETLHLQTCPAGTSAPGTPRSPGSQAPAAGQPELLSWNVSGHIHRSRHIPISPKRWH